MTEWFSYSDVTLVKGPFKSQEEASQAILSNKNYPNVGSFVWPVAAEAPKTGLSIRAQINVVKAEKPTPDVGNSITEHILPCNVVPRKRNYETQSL
jgi:hypothetical protein